MRHLFHSPIFRLAVALLLLAITPACSKRDARGGTNSKIDMSSHPTINGSVYFNGPNAGWYSGSPSGYTTVTQPKPVLWSTVDQIANEMFPSGGLTWLATHNDNASASPAIVSSSIWEA